MKANRSIIKWKSENRVLSSRMAVLKNKIITGVATERDITKFQEMAIKFGRNIARLQRMRTKLQQKKTDWNVVESKILTGMAKHFVKNNRCDKTIDMFGDNDD